MRLRYAGMCACGNAVAAGTWAGYDPAARKAVCPACLAAGDQTTTTGSPPGPVPAADAAPVDASTGPAAGSKAMAAPMVTTGRAGGSARAEYDRRAAKREARIRADHPKLGGLLLALTEDPQSTRAWASGAVGEEKVGARLDGLAGDGVLVLHDRRIPRSRANIDHIAVGPMGVFVIDAKRYVGATVEVRRSGGWFSPATEQLVVRGRDKTNLVTGLAPQVAAVYEALEDFAELDGVAVQPVLTFVDADLPWLGSMEIAGVPVLGPRATAKLVRRPGPLTAGQRERLHAHLARCLPAYQR